ESTTDGILVVDNDGKISGFNQQFAQLWRIPSTVLDSRDDDKALEFVLDQLKHPDQFIAKVRQLYSQPEAVSFDLLEFKDGRVIERYSQPQKLDGVSVGRVWSFRDITERIEAEAKRRRVEELYRKAITNIGGVPYQLDYATGKYVFMDEGIEQLTGYRAEEVSAPFLNSRLRRVNYLGQAKEFSGDEGFRRSMAGEITQWRAEYLFEKKDGSLVWLADRSVPVTDPSGKITGSLGILEDITERKRAEEAVAASEEKYRTLYNSIQDGLVLVDMQGRILECNQAYAEMLGITKEEATKLTYVQLTPEKWHAMEADIVERRIVETGYSDLYEKEYIRKNGTAFPIEIRVWLVTDKQGGPKGMWAIVKDITERKRSESVTLAFEALGRKLSSASTSEEAAKIIVEIADDLFGWDACYLDLYLLDQDVVGSILNVDIVDGKRADVPPVRPTEKPTATQRRILEHGPELILREEPYEPTPGLEMFGNKSRLSASIMLAPLRKDEKRIGILSIQSYTPNAYEENDLATFQALADHCAGALERISAQQALGESEARYRALFEDSPVSLWEEDFSAVKKRLDHLQASGIHDLQAYLRDHPEEGSSCAAMVKVLDVNRATLELYGTTDKEDLLGSLNKVFRQEPPDVFNDELLAVAQGRKVSQVETAMRTLGGVEKHVSLRWSVASGHEKTMSRVLISCTDITERKQAEEKLRESEARLKEAQTLGRIGNWEFDVANQIVTWSDETYRLYERDPAMGPPGVEEEAAYYSPEQVKKLREYASCAIEQGRAFEYDLEARLPSGKIAHFAATMRPGKDGTARVVRLFGTVQDITERKLAEEALRESEKKFRDLVENSLVGVYVIQDGIFRYVNPKLAEIFGYESDQLIGKKGPMDLTHPQYRPIVENNIAKRLSGEIHSVHYEFKGVTRDERAIDVEVYGSGTLYNGKAAVVGTLLDVSESKHSQQNLRDYSQRLERLSHRLLEVQEAERRGLARELHDQVGQALTALKINIQSIQRLSDPAALRARLHESIAIVDQTIDQVRSLSLDLRPSLLDDLGLVPALRWYLDRTAQRAELKANFTAEPLESRPSPEIETACFRVAQEALTNVIRHAHARRIEVMLRQTNDLLELI
ncbi:MAG: PAS domain S-box protein, partial [bacterium]